MRPIRKCGFCGKEKEISAHGLCAACYQRYRKRGKLDYIKVKKPCSVDNCDGIAEAHGLCAKHLKRWQRHSHYQLTRPNGWGSKEKHPLHQIWVWRRRKYGNLVCKEWREDFWQFVKDIEERPSKKHILSRIDESKGFFKENVEWVKPIRTKESSESFKEYARQYQKEYRKSHKGQRRIKDSYLRKHFGISFDDYDKLFRKQNGLCAICDEREANDYSLAVDHDHKKDKIRGLLCQKCNQALGLFKDSTDLLAKAITYLQRI